VGQFYITGNNREAEQAIAATMRYDNHQRGRSYNNYLSHAVTEKTA